jgi:hypothetical protein
VFSTEVNVYAKSSTQPSETVVVNKNPPTQDTRDWKDNTEKEIDSLLIDLDWALSNLKDQATKEKAVEDLTLVKLVMDANEDILRLQTQLNAVDISKVLDSDLREQLSKTDASIARTKKTTPQSLELVKESSNLQATTSSDVELAVVEFFEFGRANYSESQTKSYVNQMHKINGNVRVESVIKTLSIEYLDENQETRILLNKEYAYESPEQLNNVIVIEIIPKTVAGDASSIDLRTPGFNIINNDPVISWTYNTLSSDKKTMSYVLMANDNSESVKSTKTIVLVDPLYVITESNLITGFSVLLAKVPKFEVLGLVFGIFIILGLVTYYFVAVNEVNIKTYIKIPKFKKSVKVDSALTKFTPLFNSDSPVITIPEQYFHVKNGDVLRSITELDNVLENMDDFTYFYHVHDKGNDFADWVEVVYHNSELASLIRSKNKNEVLKLIKTIKGGI